MGGNYHRSVMLEKAATSLNLKGEGVYVDGTLGGGGHASEILRRSAPEGVLIGIDRDDDALEESRRVLEPFGARAILVKGNFRDIRNIVARLGMDQVDGILLDLGVSSHQLDTSSRGFSFAGDGPLDMRMNRQDSLSAYDIVNTWSEARLKDIIREYGEERRAGRIAGMIVRSRQQAPLETTGELAAIVAKASGPRAKKEKIHPATRTFQALRLCVNRELEDLPVAIEESIDILRPGRGRLSIIAFHSLEDRIVKHLFRQHENPCHCPPHFPYCVCGKEPSVKVLTRRALMPDPVEMEENPRARSARLRTVEKV